MKRTNKFDWVECTHEEIAREKAKYTKIIDSVSEIPLDTEPGKYLFNNKIVYVLDTERVYTGNTAKPEVRISFLLENDNTNKYSGFTCHIRKLTGTKRGSHSKLNK